MMSACQEFQVLVKKSKNELSHYHEFESNLVWLKAGLKPITGEVWFEDIASYSCFNALCKN